MFHKVSQWRSGGRILLFLFACASLLVMISSLPTGQHGPVQELIIGSLASIGSFVLTLVFVRWDGLRLRDVGAMPQGCSPVLLVTGFVLGLFLVALHSFLVGIVGPVHWIRAAGPTAGQATIVVTAYLFLAAREELAFHGYPLRRLQYLIGVWGAQAIIATVFALEHMVGGWSLAQALWGAAVGSLLFGMASIATRGLAVPIGIHAAWNFGDWMRGNRAEPGVWRPQIEAGLEGAASRAGVWCYLLVMGLAILGFWFWHRKRGAAKVRDASTL